MKKSLLRLLGLACRHRHTSKPFAPATNVPRNDNWDAVPATAGSHYVVCFDCGRELRYDWSQMKISER